MYYYSFSVYILYYYIQEILYQLIDLFIFLVIERNNKIILFYGIVWFFVLSLWFYLKTPASVPHYYWNYFIHLAT